MPKEGHRASRRPVSRKIVVIGDGACGKTSLLNVFAYGHFPSAYEPTVFENHVKTLLVDGQEVDLSLWDTAGQEEFDRLRSLSYADTHVIMICFSVDSPISLENVQSKWLLDVTEHCPGVKMCLVALKCDLRDDPYVLQHLATQRQRTVTYEQGLQVARDIGASRYLECSAYHDRGVVEAFTETTKVATGARAKGLTETSSRSQSSRPLSTV